MPQPQPGEVIFYAACPPPLTAGDYRLEVDQSITGGGLDVLPGGSPFVPVPDEDFSSGNIPALTRDFAVEGPRFSLNPADIHAVFPPPNSSGHFETRLPLVVLGRRTLPWERTIDGGPRTASSPPWMALLLFEEGEVTLLDPPACTVGTITSPDGGIDWDGFTLPAPAADLNQPCLGIEVARSLFRRVAPMQSELRWLCHARQVNTEDKELLGQDLDGWFSVVVGNRLPEAGKTYVACLVSLEGAGGLLPGADDVHEYLGAVVDPGGVFDSGLVGGIDAGPVPGTSVIGRTDLVAGTSLPGHAARLLGRDTRFQFDLDTGQIIFVPQPRVRLVTLTRWRFTCAGAGDFESIMSALPDRGGVAMIGMAPQDAVAPDRVPETAYRLALESGHVPLDYLTRGGERSVAWYRGPLTPVGVDREAGGPYHSADQARRIDPQTGLENLGYAAAFELGRLLALSDPRFAVELLRWRRDGSRRVVSLLKQIKLETRLPEFIARLDPRLELLPRQLAARLIDDLGRDLLAARLAPLADPTGLAELAERMPGLQAGLVSEALVLDPAIVSRMLVGSLAGSGDLLGELGIADPAATDASLGRLLQRGLREVGHLAAARQGMLAGLRREGGL